MESLFDMTSYRYFQPYAMADIQRQIRFRDGETKLGEHVAVPGDQPLEEFLGNTRAEFVVLGIAEDIGVKANYGRPGTASAWNAFLASFLNVHIGPQHLFSVVIGSILFRKREHCFVFSSQNTSTLALI